MKKRTVSVFLLIAILFSALCVRIYSLSENSVSAAKSNSSMSVEIDTLRGTIYDCNFKPLTNSENVTYAAVTPTENALAEIDKIFNGEILKSVTERILNGKPVVMKTENIVDTVRDIKFFSVPQRYNGHFACHIIGYLDSEGKGVSGMEKAYDSLLSGCSQPVSVRFRADAGGRIMRGVEAEINGNKAPDGGTVLTIDRDIQQIAEDALDSFEIEKGCAIIIDVKSGAIRACASRPYFEQDNLSASLNDENSPFINRAFSPFSVGSVFKPVIAAAAIENGIEDFEYSCNGSIDFSGITFNCHKEDGHGILNLERAIAFSCNTFFSSLGQKVGAVKITETAEKFGFGKNTELAPGMFSASGNLPDASELDSAAAIANISFGQGQLTATPLQICSMTATIANSGIYISPYIVRGETDSDGNFTEYRGYSEQRQIIEESTADFLRSAMEGVVDYGSGSRAKSEKISTAGKTATAQTGRFGTDGEIYNAWFTGYFPAEEPKYAVTVLKEDGGEGAVSCAPVFRYIAEHITESGL